MYLGASPLSALYTSSRTLNWMRNLMRTGAIHVCSCFLNLDTILASLFCNLCSFAIKSGCIPIRRALQYSKRDITSDCITVLWHLLLTRLAFPIHLRLKLDLIFSRHFLHGHTCTLMYMDNLYPFPSGVQGWSNIFIKHNIESSNIIC